MTTVNDILLYRPTRVKKNGLWFKGKQGEKNDSFMNHGFKLQITSNFGIINDSCHKCRDIPAYIVHSWQSPLLSGLNDANF